MLPTDHPTTDQAASSHAEVVASTEPGTSLPPQPPALRLRVGGLSVPTQQRPVVEVADLVAFLAEQQPPDTAASVDAEVALVVLNADAHHWAATPAEAYLDAIVASMCPPADFSFQGPGPGLTLLFAGPDARRRALGAAASMPVDFALEIAQQFRHPRSISSKHQAEAGHVRHDPMASRETFSFCHVGAPRVEQVAEMLALRGMAIGGRSDHAQCPIAGHQQSEAGECVTALTAGIFCHLCAGKGLCLDGVRKPGYVPYRILSPDLKPFLADLATNLVHAVHARHEIAHRYPNLNATLRDELYRLVLIDVHGEGDPRIQMVFDPRLDVVFTDAGWIDASTGKSTVLDNDIIDSLPAANVVEDVLKDGRTEQQLKVDRIQRSNIKTRVPRGYTPLTLYRGIRLRSRPGEIPFEVPSRQRYPIGLLDQPLPIDEVLAAFQAAFPGIHPGYLQATLAAAICAECADGPPPSVTCTGPSGSAKTETIAIAASCLGDVPVKGQLGSDPEAFLRHIGMATAGGCRFLVFDELGKEPGLRKKWQHILQIGARIDYRPLFSNSLSVECRSAFFFPCVSFPEWLRSAPEFRRRTRGIQLRSKVPNWLHTCGGDAAGWRRRSERNARVCNSLFSHVHAMCVSAGFIFDNAPGCVADQLGLGSIGDGVESVDPERQRDLYRYARGDLGTRVFFENDPKFTKGWLDLSAPVAARLIDVFMDGNGGNLQTQRQAVQESLAAVSWSEVLGISEPIQISIMIHGKRWGMRFGLAVPCLRGKEVLNEHLPPITADEALATRPVAPPAAVSDAPSAASMPAPAGLPA